MIGVGPSAPWNENDHQRWCLPEADEYLADVIRECKTRFNVDPDRVFLCGHSMGGFGAYHQVQRQPDRFAAGVPLAGGGNPSFAGEIATVPQWIFHDAQDPTVSVENSRRMVAALLDTIPFYIGTKHLTRYLRLPSPGTTQAAA